MFFALFKEHLIFYTNPPSICKIKYYCHFFNDIPIRDARRGPCLNQGPLYRYGRKTQIFHYKVRGFNNPYSFTENLYLFEKHIKAEGMTQFWYLSYSCRKFSGLGDMLFLSSTPSSQNLIHQKMLIFEQLKNQGSLI